MIRWPSLLGTMMLVLMLWTGVAAHAAERFDCIPVTAEVAGHFEGDRDEAPSGPDQGKAHHHSGCSGHQLAAPADQASIEITFAGNAVPASRQQAGVPGHGPSAALRPPIA